MKSYELRRLENVLAAESAATLAEETRCDVSALYNDLDHESPNRTDVRGEEERTVGR